MYRRRRYCSVVDSALDSWFTTGRFAKELERKLARFVGVRSASLVNSGSSANLLALSALTSPKLGRRALKPGDEVITVAAGFPTTVNPIFQNELVPDFLDVTLPTYEIDVTHLEDAYSPRVKAVMIAHTLGNVFNVNAVAAFCRKYNLWLIEDCCDALGSTYKGRMVGTFGDIATLSFYPAHHITTGEGGAVLTNQPALQVLIESFRDWAATAGASQGSITRVVNASIGNSAPFRAVTTTNTPTRISVTTLRRPICRLPSGFHKLQGCRSLSGGESRTSPIFARLLNLSKRF